MIKKAILFLIYFCSIAVVGQVDNTPSLDSVMLYYSTQIELTADPLMYVGRSFAYKNQGNLELAIEDVSEAIDLYGESVDDTVLVYRAALYLLVNEKRKTYADLDRALIRNPNDLNSLYIMGYSKFYFEDYSEGKLYFDKLIELDPENAEAYYYRYMCNATGHSEDSLVQKDLYRALAFSESDTSEFYLHLTFELGYFNEGRARYDSALSYYQNTWRLDSTSFDDFGLAYRIGTCHFYLENYQAAIASFKMYEFGDELLNCRYSEARSYEHLEMYLNARDIYDDILEDSSLDAENEMFATLHRGVCNYFLGDYIQALRDLKRAKRKWFDSTAYVNYYLGLTYLAQNDTEEACEYLCEKVELNFHGDEGLQGKFARLQEETCSCGEE